jgi:DNA invertase Pin-like site-specific DNA recombinase
MGKIPSEVEQEELLKFKIRETEGHDGTVYSGKNTRPMRDGREEYVTVEELYDEVGKWKYGIGRAELQAELTAAKQELAKAKAEIKLLIKRLKVAEARPAPFGGNKGKKPTAGRDKGDKIMELHRKGRTKTAIAAEVGLHRQTVGKIINEKLAFKDL